MGGAALGPEPLPHKQLFALAGDAYRERVASVEDDPEYESDAFLAQVVEAQASLHDWCGPESTA